ncbi:MAG: hypothetical protein AB7I37_19690 [Pirellulales bacterium]
MSRLVLASLLLLVGSSLLADEGEARTWKGTWNNRRFKTSGPLQCVAVEDGEGNWKATFSGTFQNDPFSYDVTFASKKKKSQYDLSGTAKIQQFDYEWKGSIKGKNLVGEYEASNGFNGSFQLKEEKKKR